MVHQAMAGKLYTFQSNRDMDVIKPKKPQQTQMVKIFQLGLAVETFFFQFVYTEKQVIRRVVHELYLPR